MRSSLAFAGLLLCLSTASDAQEEVAPERIERIKAKMADNLRRLPNYTCTETIERYMRGPRSRIFAPLDTLRLEVALVDGNELFARVGAGKFAEKDIWEIVGDDAAIGNGDFALIASNVFLSQQPVFTQVGATTLNGSPAIRYDYRVARELSGYRIRIKSRQTTVGYHGSFWVQPDTLDLIRLEAHADSIPPDLDLAEASHTLEYQPVRIGEADFLLPQVSELAMIDRAGNENRNRTELDSCRQYIAESAIRFVPPVPAAEPRQSPAISVAKTDAAALQAAQKPLPAEILLLARIKARAAENLQRLPNYTCTETIERTRRLHGSRKFQPLDILRLEVALVEGKELFSWPGAGKFEERGIGEIVGHGAAIGNGAFALHAKSIFISRSPNFTYVGNTTLDGRDAIRYDYRVPQMLSGYLMRIGANQAIVGYHGSFWVEPDTLDLIRIEVRADNLPPSLALAESSDTLEYHRVRIGEIDFLLPQSSELVMIDLAGNESRNRTRLGGCRQYAGESVLTFAELLPDVPAPAPAAKPILIPAGLNMELQLQTPIQSGRSAIGDPVKALLSRDVKMDGKTVAPKGALLTGRITRLEKRHELQDYYVVGLEFSTIEFDNRRGDLRAKLQDPGLGQPSRGAFGRGGQPQRWQLDNDTSSTGGVFAVTGSNVSLRKGHTMVWRTQP